MILSDGVLYGTASSGTGDAGAVFSIGLDGGNFQVLHAFAVTQTDSAGVSTNADGADSVSPLVLDDDTLYGTTSEGGTNGSGTIFSYNLDTQVFTVLHTFGPQTNIGSDQITNVDGSAPNAGLLLLNNQLYGVTVNGGTNGAGLIFSLNLDGSGYTILHEFPKPWFFYDGITATYTNSEGFHPYGTLIASNGTLYGTAADGGFKGSGSVFSLGTNGSNFTILHMFSEAFDNQNGDGMRPMAGLFLDGNSLYGTTFYGGEAANGVLFSVGLNNTNFSLLHTFNPGSDASNPEGVLCGNANTIYGTAPDTLFSLALADTNYYVLHTFEGGADDGAGPEGGLLLVSNTLYGASVGGGTPGDGTIYSLVPPGPTIEAQPTNVSVAYGGSTDFTVVAVPGTSTNLYYQWYYDGTPLIDGPDVSGSTSNTLTLSDVGTNDIGQYFVVVFDDVGSTNSASANLSVIDEVSFPDPALDAGVLAALGLSSGPITFEELQNLTGLTLENDGVMDTTGLEFALNLIQLDLSGNTLTNLSPLAEDVALQSLHLNSCGLTNLTFLAPLTNVNDLQLDDNLFADISPVTNLAYNLTEFQMDGNSVTNLPVLAALTNLVGFYVSQNNVTDISFMAGYVNLLATDISQNNITDISPLANILNLNTLYAGSNQITNGAPLAVLTNNLGVLYLSSNPIQDASFLNGLTNMVWLALDNTSVTNISFLTHFGRLFYLDLSYIPVGSVTPLTITPSLPGIGYLIVPGINLGSTAFMSAMTNLQGVNLEDDDVTSISSFGNLYELSNVNLGSNSLTDISPLAGKTNIFTLDISYNAVHDLSPLAGLTAMNYLAAPGNGFTNINALAGMTLLNILLLSSNHIQDISPLTNKPVLNTLDLSYNQVSNLAPLSGDTDLVYLYLDHNAIQDLTPLTGLTMLNYVDLTYNWLDLNPDSPDSVAIQTLTSQNTTVATVPQNSALISAVAVGGVHNIHFTINGPPASVWQVQFSTNLLATQWVSLGNVTNTTGSVLFTDPAATNSIRFYRLLGQ